VKTFWLPLALFILLVLIGGYFVADYYTGLPEDIERNYVGREACVTCHQEQASLFHNSHHDLAMDLATDETVLADFDHTLEHHGLTSKMYREGDRFMIRTDGADGEMNDFEVKYVFGVFPLQQYMVEMPQDSPAPEGAVGRLQVLRESWDVENNRWFYLNPPDVSERLEGDDPLHWTSITQQWNTTCAECHSTNLEKNYDVTSRSFHTTFSEIDVSCEACHGPGSLHVKLAEANSPFWDNNHGFGLAKLKTESNLPQVEMCATCHSRRREIHGQFAAGERYDEHFQCNLLMDQVYHADGQIRDEDYVYGSFKQSKMFHKGIKCTDCHDPHSTKIKFKGNDLCTSCHQHPAGQYDSPNHHHHQVGSTGSLCVECHMPETTYMNIDPRRDHSLRVPRPDLSVKYSTPNACTGCHLKEEVLSVESQGKVSQYLDWILEAEDGNEEIAAELKRVDQLMAQSVVDWYGETSDARTDSYYEKLAKVRVEGDLPTAVELMGDRDVPSIVRASAGLAVVNEDDPETLAVSLENLNSKFSDVVFAALMRVQNEMSRLASLPQPTFEQRSALRELSESVAALLDSEQRPVRIEAARVLGMIPTDIRSRMLSGGKEKLFNNAFAELETSTLMESDTAGSHLSLGGLYEMRGEMEKAEGAYRTAIKIAPNESRARGALAVLLQDKLNQMNRAAASVQQQGATVKQIKSLVERMDGVQNEIVKLRNDENRVLARDVELFGETEGSDLLHYRYAMSCYLKRDLELTEKHLKIACEQVPDNADYLIAMASYYDFVQQIEPAIEFTKRAMEVNPNDRSYNLLLQKLLKARPSQEVESDGN
jgi:predicted CXXCH cytochrome family protein